MKRIIVAITLVLAVTVGTTLVAASPASADDAYGTKWHNSSGFNGWGLYNQTTSNRSTVLMLKDALRTGTAIGAVAELLCISAAPLVAKAICLYAGAKDGTALRDAINSAYKNGKCVTLRFYAVQAANALARTVNSGYCWFPQYGSYGTYDPGCPGGFCGGGGGGGGGGGSWRQESGS